jgi:cyclohexyl-isocyanide hydratase
MIDRQDREQLPLSTVMLVYPGFTLLDLAGPHGVFGMYGQVCLAWKTLDPVTSDSGVSVLPTATFGDCPPRPDILFVPGGFGTQAIMQDGEVLAFLAQRARCAAYVTSVCSGSLVLAAAGLLDGYRATTHWAAKDVLASFGVEIGAGRVVMDRNRCSGGGVTAGLDFGLALLAKLRGETAARVAQLAMEYDPQPPFEAGTPEKAGSEVTALATRWLAERRGAGEPRGDIPQRSSP